MKVYVCGDTHIPTDISKLSTKNWEDQKHLTKDDLLIILGDCGILWENIWSREELYWAKWLAEKNFTTCFIDGNHENFDRLNSLDIVDFHGGQAGQAYKDDNGTIYHLKRGEIYTFGDRTVFTFGGATSIDKGRRIIGRSWWPEEVQNYAEENFALNNLDKFSGEVDYILTHTAPSSIVSEMFGTKLECPVSKFLEEVKKTVYFREWHFGHFHTSQHKDMKYICHYNWEPKRII